MSVKSSNYIGIYVDYNTITVSSAQKTGDKIFIRKIFHLNIDYKVEGLIKPLSLNLDFFNEKQQWAIKLKETFKKIKIDTTNIIVSLSHNFSVTRFFTMPYAERKFWNKAIPIESKKHIPVAFDELGYDFFAIPIGENQKLGVIFSVTQKKTTEFFSQLLKDCGMKIEMVEPVVYSFYRIAEYLSGGKENYLFVYTKADDVYTCLIWKKIPILYRYISFSKSPSFSDRKTLDLKGSIMFLQRNVPDVEIKDVFVSGDNIEFASSQVKKEIQIEPIIIETKSRFEPQDDSFEILMSVSASLKNKIKTDYIIDISENQKSKRIIETVNKFIIGLTGSIVFLFLVLYFLNVIRTYTYNNKINSYYSQMPEILEFENMPVAVIEDNVKKMSKVARVMRAVFEKREYFTPKLAAISDTIPKDVWIKSLIFTNPVAVDISANPTVDLIADAETYLVGESRTYYLDYFMKELKKKKAFEICIPPRGRLDYETKDPENIIDTTLNIKNYMNFISKIKFTCNGKK
ncbi:MAG: hypothetical protein N2Z20_02035 [Elusimicrobiales bacterium]|nr:hypothetical protein [Elusimicrobiales bacterium]